MNPATDERSTDVECKPRLLVLASTYPRWPDDPEPGFVHELSKRLTSQFDVVVVCPHTSDARAWEMMDGVKVVRYRYAPERWETLVNNGGIVANLRRRKWKIALLPGFVLAQIWQAWRQIRKERVDVVHAHWIVPQGLIARFLSLLNGGVPFVVTSHGADLFALRGRAFDWLRGWTVKRAAYCTVVSAVMHDAMKRIGIDEGRVSVLPMGIDLKQRFSPGEVESSVPDRLLFVGRLVEKKGLRFLLEAMPLVLAERPRAHLMIAGFGPEESNLRSLVRRLGLADNVEFLGPVSQEGLPALYRSAALFVAPFVESASGDQEGLGLVTIEALGCGCPVIAGNVPAVSDILGRWPDCIVDPRDINALASGILDALRDPAAARENAFRIRSDLYARMDWSVIAGKYSDILMRQVRSQGRHMKGDGSTTGSRQ